MWHHASGNGNIICKNCNMVFSIMIKNDYFCPKCHYGIEEVKEVIRKVEMDNKKIDNIKYFNDDVLITKLKEIGYDIGGYLYTKSCNENGYEKGKWEGVLKNRMNSLDKDISCLIEYIKEKY